MRVFILLSSLVLHSVSANAGFNIGTGALYTDIKDPNHEYVDTYKPELNSVSIGYNKEINKFNIGASTNRLLTKQVKRKVNCNGATCLNMTRVNYDSLQLGYRIRRYIPNIFIANTQIRKSLFLNGNRLGIQNNSIIIYGFGGTYLLTRNVSITTNILMPNKEVYMKKGLGLSINYNF